MRVDTTLRVAETLRVDTTLRVAETLRVDTTLRVAETLRVDIRSLTSPSSTKKSLVAIHSCFHE